MPNIKVGSVIDIQITFDGIPPEWEFQQEIPVVHSELIIEQSPYITYNKNYFGYIPLSVNTNRRWVLQNAPAFKPEPYITSSKNYRARFEFDIEEVAIPPSSRTYTNGKGNTYRMDYSGNYKSYTKTWESVRDILYEKKRIDSWGWADYVHDHFKLALESDSYLDETVKDIKSRFPNRDETIKAAFEYVKQIKWNKTNSFFADKMFLSSAYKEGEGNTADINLALVQLLCKLGLDAGPVIMSSRENGTLSAFHPSFNKLNYVIAAVFTEKDTILLDATEKNSPYYLLPMRALNGHGQFVDKKRTGWIPLDSHKKDKQMVVYTMSIEEDQSIKGKISYLKGDYAALEFRNEYENFNSEEEYILNFKKNIQGLKIISHKIDNLDSLYKPVNQEFDIEIKDGVSVIDSELYINPLLNEQIKENPFKVSEREYPIDFGYARDKTLIVNYVFPKGYMVVNLPENASMKLPENTASFSCRSTVTEGKITIVYKISVNTPVFVQTQYADLREFYNQIVAKEAEPIVLKKN